MIPKTWGNKHVSGLCSETTWSVGIAQLTHHEVRGGGENHETGGRWILAPTAVRVASWLRNTDHPCRFAFISHFICVIICISLKSDSDLFDNRFNISNNVNWIYKPQQKSLAWQ